MTHKNKKEYSKTLVLLQYYQHTHSNMTNQELEITKLTNILQYFQGFLGYLADVSQLPLSGKNIVSYKIRQNESQDTNCCTTDCKMYFKQKSNPIKFICGSPGQESNTILLHNSLISIFWLCPRTKLFCTFPCYLVTRSSLSLDSMQFTC